MPDGYYVGVPTPTLVYIGCPDRAEFDKIGVEATDHGLDENGNHLITKMVEGPGTEPGRPVWAIFQHWIAQETTDHLIERIRREKVARDSLAPSESTANRSTCEGGKS